MQPYSSFIYCLKRWRTGKNFVEQGGKSKKVNKNQFIIKRECNYGC